MRSKLTGRAREALDDLETAPASEDNRADLRKQFAKVLEGNAALAQELKALLPSEAGKVEAMSQDVSGTGAKAAQVRGNKNTISIS